MLGLLRERRQRRERRRVGPNGWLCHVCGRYRPDGRISVLSRDRMIGHVPVRESVRYCNDRPACQKGAESLSWLGKL